MLEQLLCYSRNYPHAVTLELLLCVRALQTHGYIPLPPRWPGSTDVWQLDHETLKSSLLDTITSETKIINELIRTSKYYVNHFIWNVMQYSVINCDMKQAGNHKMWCTFNDVIYIALQIPVRAIWQKHPVYVLEAHTFNQLTLIVRKSNTTKNHSLSTSHKHEHPQGAIFHLAWVKCESHSIFTHWQMISSQHQTPASEVPNLAITGNWPGPFCVQCCGRQFPRGHCSWVSACWEYKHGRIECKVASLVTMWGETVTGEGKPAQAWVGGVQGSLSQRPLFWKPRT